MQKTILITKKENLIDSYILGISPEAQLLDSGNIHLCRGVEVNFKEGDEVNVSANISNTSFSTISALFDYIGSHTEYWLNKGFVEIREIVEEQINSCPEWATPKVKTVEQQLFDVQYELNKANTKLNSYETIVTLLKQALDDDNLEDIEYKLRRIIYTQQHMQRENSYIIRVSSPEELKELFEALKDMFDKEDDE